MAVQQMDIQQENAEALAEQRRALAEERRLRADALEREATGARARGEAFRQGGGVRKSTLDWATQNAPDQVPWFTEFFDTADKRAGEIGKLRNDLNNARLDHLGHLSDGILQRGATPEAIQTGLSLYAEQFPDEADQVAQLGERLQGMNPEQVKGFLEQQRSAAPFWQARKAATPKVVGNTLVSDTGEVLYREPTEPKGDTRSLDVQAADALARGDKATYDRLLRVKKEMGQADDRPVDPTVAAIRDLTLQQARANVGRLPARQQTRVDSVAKGFDSQPIVKRAQTLAENLGFVESISIDTTNPSDDQALIYAFAKAMDPESVVREGEYATAKKYSQSWPAAMKASLEQSIAGKGFLSREARKNIRSTLRTKFTETKRQYDNLRSSTAKRINSITGQQDGDAYLIDYGGAFPTEPANTPGGTNVGGFIVKPKGGG